MDLCDEFIAKCMNDEGECYLSLYEIQIGKLYNIVHLEKRIKFA